MNYQNDFFLNVSAIYRNCNKYFDHNLAKYEIGSGQIMFLLLINEYEGITMQQLSSLLEMDKGTTTKSIQKLIDQNYIEVVSDETDKRFKKLYTTSKANEIMGELYQLRNNCFNQLSNEMNIENLQQHIKKAVDNSRNLVKENEDYQQMLIGGFQKLSLLDYPGKMAATIFTSGCNFKCPFCHNKDLVFIPENFDYYTPDDILSYLQKRKGILDGICITGGEPLIQKGLLDFISRVKQLGLSVKLDTNGYMPQKLKTIVESGLIDFVAMDIKNSEEKYGQTTGMNSTNIILPKINESIDYLLQGNVDYEFRTTVVKDFHTVDDLLKIAERINGCQHYYLQQFKDSGNIIEEGLSGYSDQQMKEMYERVAEILPQAELRGVN